MKIKENLTQSDIALIVSQKIKKEKTLREKAEIFLNGRTGTHEVDMLVEFVKNLKENA